MLLLRRVFLPRFAQRTSERKINISMSTLCTLCSSAVVVMRSCCLQYCCKIGRPQRHTLFLLRLQKWWRWSGDRWKMEPDTESDKNRKIRWWCTTAGVKFPTSDLTSKWTKTMIGNSRSGKFGKMQWTMTENDRRGNVEGRFVVVCTKSQSTAGLNTVVVQSKREKTTPTAQTRTRRALDLPERWTAVRRRRRRRRKQQQQ